MADTCFLTANAALPGDKANAASYALNKPAEAGTSVWGTGGYYKYLKLALLVSSAMAITAAGATDSSEYRDIFSVSDITQNIMDQGTDPVVCGEFKLSTKQVLYYFKHAREVISRTYAHDLDYSPCHVTGKLMLKTGVSATWEINLSGIGSMNFDDGHVMFLNCERCIPKQ
jgi:hypothetical protein